MLTGTAFGGCKGRTQLPELVGPLHERHAEDRRAGHEEIPLEQINEAFEWMQADQGYRYIVKY